MYWGTVLRGTLLRVQTQQQRYSKTPQDILLNSDRYTKQISDFAFHSKICPKEKSEPSTQPFCATPSKEALQQSRERDSNCPVTLDSSIYTVCRSKAVITPAGASHHYLACSLLSTPLLPLEACTCYRTWSFRNQPDRSQRKQPSFHKPVNGTTPGSQACSKVFCGQLG